MDKDSIQADRIGAARQWAKKWKCVVVLKGAFSVIATPDGQLAMLPFATDALAKAGTGDALAGCIVGLLAQGAAPFDAAVAGAYVHGLAGTLCAAQGAPRSTLASDVIDQIPVALNQIEELAR
jgi:NAD(P)H-hydrate epimerase